MAQGLTPAQQHALREHMAELMQQEAELKRRKAIIAAELAKVPDVQTAPAMQAAPAIPEVQATPATHHATLNSAADQQEWALIQAVIQAEKAKQMAILKRAQEMCTVALHAAKASTELEASEKAQQEHEVVFKRLQEVRISKHTMLDGSAELEASERVQQQQEAIFGRLRETRVSKSNMLGGTDEIGNKIRLFTALLTCGRAKKAGLSNFTYTGDTAPAPAGMEGLRLEGRMRHGHGEIRYESGTMYTGQWVNDRRTGTGTFVLACGDTYVGQWLEGMYEGRGKYASAPGRLGNLEFVYEGEWRADKPHGHGRYVYPASGEWYEGGWVDGKREGHGKALCADGYAYEGTWTADEPGTSGQIYVNAQGGRMFDTPWNPRAADDSLGVDRDQLRALAALEAAQAEQEELMQALAAKRQQAQA